MNKEEIEVFLDKDGWTAYFKAYPWISAGGETKKETIVELRKAFDVAKKVFNLTKKFA